jgi:hypothetical protein
MKTQIIKLAETNRKTIIHALRDQINTLKSNNEHDEIAPVVAALKEIREPEIKAAKKSFERISKIIEEAGVEVKKFYPYSGRCMFGEYCVGATIGRYEYNDLVKVFKKKKVSFSSDNMGMDMVVYFQYLSSDDILKDEDDEDE